MHAGFVQGGLASSKDTPGLLSVGRIAYEPLWVFYTGSAKLERLTDLKGKRILVGPAGGGTSGLALRLLAANGITGRNRDADQPRAAGLCRHARQRARRMRAFSCSRPRRRTIQRLLRTPNVGLMSFANADAYIQRFPFLSRLVLREGVVDFAANIPPADTTLIATTAAVLVREDAHRALVNLLAQALHEVHGQPATDGGQRGPAVSARRRVPDRRTIPSSLCRRRRGASTARARRFCSATCRSGSPPWSTA